MPRPARIAATTFLLGTLLAFGTGPSIAQDSTLTAVSWGGAYAHSQTEAFFEPFAAKTGIRVNVVNYNGGLAEIRQQIQANRVEWDVVDANIADVVQGCNEGLLEPIEHTSLPPSPEGIPAVEDFFPGTLVDCGVPNIVWSMVYAYDQRQFSAGDPRTTADFFDLDRFPGRRGLYKRARYTLELALMADGVAPAEVYSILSTPAGVDRAFAKLDTIKSQSRWWEQGDVPPQWLSNGEVAMTVAYNGRIFDAKVNQEAPFTIVWDGQIWDIDLFVIPKGSANQSAALEFIAFATDTYRLADQSKFISYGPARKSSNPLVTTHAETGTDMKPHMPTQPANLLNALQFDFRWWAANGEALERRFQDWLAQ